jgi:uncharacterized membrane protein (Fun14 family)
MNADTLASISATIGSGFFGGLILGYALKKVVKLIAVIGGLFIEELELVLISVLKVGSY